VLHAGLDLSRRRVDVCLISSEGELVEHFRAPADRDGLYGLTRRVAVYDEPVRGVVESMNGARFVHDESAWAAAHPRAMKCLLHGLVEPSATSLG
jgi:transposase